MVIRTRDNLIEYLEENASGRYLRALQNHNENLGAFSRVLRNTPGWIVKVTSKRGNTYYLVVVATATLHQPAYLLAIFFKDPPWKYWIGDTSENPLYQGDNPESYKSLRDKEMRNGN